MKIDSARMSSKVAHKSMRIAFRLLRLLLLTFLAIVLGFTWYAVSMLPPLQPWHTARLSGEFNATTDSQLDFDGYLEREKTLFENMDAEIATWDHLNEAFVYSRFNAASKLNELVKGAPYNRSFRMATPKPIGHALLIHGLTDSPYSMTAMAETLHARGFEVTVLRLPGHGTLPSMMTEMSKNDWTAAVRMAARDVASRTPVGQPFYLGGHSTGGTLALQYALDALQDKEMRMPDRLLLLSPAIHIENAAALASFIDAMSVVPIPLLEKVRWQDIEPEYDPYKFNSFPINAMRQVFQCARDMRLELDAAVKSDRITSLPPIVTWQSIVDSTIGASGAVDFLYPALKGAQHRLVLFDVNRTSAIGSEQKPGTRLLIERLQHSPRAYTLDVVGNADSQSGTINVKRWSPDNKGAVLDTGLQWPADVVSLGHVALPFRPDDPAYGFMSGSGRDDIPSIGSWLLRGENGAIALSLGALTRLRSNPFWSLIAADIDGFVTEDLAVESVAN